MLIVVIGIADAIGLIANIHRIKSNIACGINDAATAFIIQTSGTKGGITTDIRHKGGQWITLLVYLTSETIANIDTGNLGNAGTS